MKRMLMTAAASLVLAGSLSLPAFADAPRGGHHLAGAPHDSHNARGEQRNRNDHSDRGDRHSRGGNRWSGNDHHHDRYARAYRGRHVSPPRTYAYVRPVYPHYSHRWQRGERLGYYNNRYREIDYRDYRLERPPYGYRWVEDDNGDFILAALAGGLIAAIIANN
ncbi:MAG: hypothetical protein GC155_08445 [Alphaproteobacteria bacterium]|nr:hypothetical protein [Alphaproteobacteria bacterium]